MTRPHCYYNIMKPYLALAKTAYILLLLLVIVPSSAYAANESSSFTGQMPRVVTFSDVGGKTLGPLDVVEGTLTIHIGTRTDCQACYFGLSVYEDNNLDGVFASTEEGDIYTSSVWSAGYGDIQNSDLTVNHTVMGGQIKVFVDTSSRVGWDIVIEQHPQPSHGIEAGVWDEETESPIFDATVTLIDEQGNKYTTGDNSLYGYHHYYFNRSFYGYQNYTLLVSAPGYSTRTLMVTPEDFTSLGFPGWAVYKKAYLRSSSNEAVIYCKVREKDSKVPVKGATVTLQDLTGIGVSTATSDGSGLCRFEGLVEGTYTLTASAKGFTDQSKQAEALGSRTVEQVIFELERSAPGIYGTVTDSEVGNPVSNLTVELTSYGGDEILDKTTTDSRGFYTFPELKTGDYGVQISNNILSRSPDERFYEPDGRIARLKGNEYKKIDFVLKPKGVDITAGFDVVPGKKQNVTVGLNFTIDVVVSNNGPKEAGDVKLEVELDGAAEGVVELAGATPSDGSCGMSGDSVKCDLGRIQKNSVKTVSLMLKTLKVGNFTLRVFGADAPVESWQKTDWLPTNNRDNITVEIKPHRLHGQVMVPYIDYNAKPNLSNILTFGLSILKPVPLKDISVNLTHGTRSSIVYTDKNGRYSFDINDTGSSKFSLQVKLKDRPDKNGNSTIVIRSGKGFNSNPVILKTKEMEIKGVETKLDVIFTRNYSYLANSLSNDQKAVLQDAGVFYYNTYEALLFAKNKLKLGLDHKLPVDVYIYANVNDIPGNPSDCAACYYKYDSHIQTRNNKASSSIMSQDTPDNREYHEFGHHVQADSKMGGENTYPNRKTNVPYKIGAANLLHNDGNHDATKNTDSSDSFIEAFAEFFSLLVQGEPYYRWSGSVTDLSGTNYHTTGGDPDEEFNIASLLWDLYDKDSETGDYFALGIDGTWKILNSPNITTVRSLYLSLNKSYGKKDTNTTDGLNDVDALFVLHRFYYDVDRDGTRDANESIGYGNTGPAHPWVQYPRNDKPRIPGTGLEFSVSDQSGNSVEPNAFVVNVRFPDSGTDFTYLTWPDPGDGYLWVVVPDNALNVELTPLASGYTGEPFIQTPEEFWEAVKMAQAENKSTYDSHRFIVRENGVAAPEGFMADSINETAVRLVWNGGGSFVLVGGIDHRPGYPGDGETVFEGSGSEYVDSGLLTGVTYYYTLFRVEEDKVSKGVSVSFETEIVQPLLKTTTAPKPRNAPSINESASPGKTTLPADSGQSTGNSRYPLLILVIVAALIIWYWRRKNH